MFALANTRRYLSATAAWTATFLVLVFVAVKLIRLLPHDSPWRLPLACLPMLPPLAGILLDLRFLRGLDELQQRIALIGLVSGAYAVMALCIVAWLLESLAGLPRLSPLIVFLTFMAASTTGWTIAARRYR